MRLFKHHVFMVHDFSRTRARKRRPPAVAISARGRGPAFAAINAAGADYGGDDGRE